MPIVYWYDKSEGLHRAWDAEEGYAIEENRVTIIYEGKKYIIPLHAVTLIKY